MIRHILGVARTLPFHSIGGMQAIAWDLFREFARRGHTVTVLTTSVPGREQPFMTDGVRVIPLAGTRPERCDRAWWQASAKWFAQAAATGTIDGVLSVSSAGASIAARRHLAPNAKFVFQAHGTSWGEFVSKWRTGRPFQWAKSIKNVYWLVKDAGIYKRFDSIALVGDVLQTQFSQAPVRWMTGQATPVLIRNGIDERVFRPDPAGGDAERLALGWSATDPVAVFAARLHPQKGGDVALRAFARLLPDMPNAKFLLIGGGADLARLQALANTLKCSPSVHFTGAVPRERLPRLLAAGNAFVFPTLAQEGLPMNVLEALAVGLQPVCSSAMQTVFDKTLPIFYADPLAVPAFSEALRTAMQSPGSTKSLLTGPYSLSTCADQYLSILLAAGKV